MGISLQMYRIRIGTFQPTFRPKSVKTTGSSASQLNSSSTFAIMSLVLCCYCITTVLTQDSIQPQKVTSAVSNGSWSSPSIIHQTTELPAAHGLDPEPWPPPPWYAHNDFCHMSDSCQTSAYFQSQISPWTTDSKCIQWSKSEDYFLNFEIVTEDSCNKCDQIICCGTHIKLQVKSPYIFPANQLGVPAPTVPAPQLKPEGPEQSFLSNILGT